MIKCINIAAFIAVCIAGTTALAGGDTQQPAYVNDMPFPAEMPVYTPRVVFGDLPFMGMDSGDVVAVFDDLPFPAEMKKYVPARHFADLPTRADTLADISDQAMLQVGE